MTTQTNDSVSQIEALIYSKFENIGPQAVAWHPKVNNKTLAAVALKSINLFAAEGGKVPESISVIPFSAHNMIGIVKCIEIEDPQARGGARDATLTILVNEKYNNLILRYIDDFDKLLDNITGRILINEQISAEVKEFKKVIEESFSYIIDNIEIFQAIEKDREELMYEPKIEQLKDMISKIEEIIEEYIKDVDEFGTNEVKDVLKLTWDIKQIDFYHSSPEEIRRIVDLANILKMKKESITIQKHKLEQYKTQMTPDAVDKLNEQIDHVSANLETFIEKLMEVIKELASRSEKVIESQSKKKKGKTVAFIFQKQFAKLRNELKSQFDLFKTIEELPLKKFKMVKAAFLHLDKMRTLKRNREVGKAADKIANILQVDRNHILKVTRDPSMKEDFNRIFQY